MDLKIVNAKLVLDGSVVDGEIGIDGGKIVAVGQVKGTFDKTLDAGGVQVLPGVIDSHVHFNDPGRDSWEGIATGSRALAAGGGTVFIDMPLNASPPTLDAKSFDAKVVAAQKSSLTDFALWGGLTPINLDQMEELAQRGVIGFKAFMSGSGIDDFPRSDEAILEKGMRIAAKLGLLVAVHAEDEAMVSALGQRAISAGQTAIKDYLASRPIEAEVKAITTACDLAHSTGCSLHIVHVSSGQGIATVLEKRKAGIDVTCETCPHYLVLTEDDLLRIGAAAKCAPPLRSDKERNSLWQHLQEGHIDFIASDHSPSPISMKESQNFFNIWGGIAGVQSMLSNMLVEGHLQRNLSLSSIAKLLSSNVARRFRIPGKGKIAIGFDADLVFIDLKSNKNLESSHLHYRHAISPYLGLLIHGLINRTLLRGQTIYHDGIFFESQGRLITPTK
ncbi:MAG TPA: allantoinase AllB [Tepidisphaeraceae bacterium]